MLGTELRNARIAAGLTQEELAYQAGIDRSYLSQLERGKKSPTLDMLFRICDTLNIQASALIARVEQSRRTTS